MSVREALDALLATHTGEVMTHDGRFVPDCDPDKLADLIDALAALREQAGVDALEDALLPIVEPIARGDVEPGQGAYNLARAALRALGLEDA